MSGTHAYAELAISAAAYNEIKGKLVEAGYVHEESDALDMHGLALVSECECYAIIMTAGRYQRVKPHPDCARCKEA